MEELYLETGSGRIALSPEMIRKYNLQRGGMLPFTRYRVVGQNGDFTRPPEKKASANAGDDPKVKSDAVEDNGGIILQKSEILDLAAGVDSETMNSQ